jgi:hypothetical protein
MRISNFLNDGMHDEQEGTSIMETLINFGYSYRHLFPEWNSCGSQVTWSPAIAATFH